MSVASPDKKKRPGSSRAPQRYDAFITGELSVEDLDMEELLRGQLRDKAGSFTGRPPYMIPRSFHVKVTQELLHRAESTWRENMSDAMNVFVEIMNNPRVRAQDRLYAAQYVFERIAGKIPEKQFIEATVRKWEDVAEAVIVEVTSDDYIDVEVVRESGPEPVLTVQWDDDPVVEEDQSTPAGGGSDSRVRAIEAPAPSRKVAPRRPSKKKAS